jgi:hypothetical protein
MSNSKCWHYDFEGGAGVGARVDGGGGADGDADGDVAAGLAGWRSSTSEAKVSGIVSAIDGVPG